MNNWMPTKKFLIFIISIGCLSILLYSGGLFMVLREISKIKDFYANSESAVSKEKRIQAIKTITESNAENIDTLRKFLIQKGDEVEFIEELESAGRDSGAKFEISSIEVKLDAKNSSKENIEMSIATEGSWKEVVTFINDLEKMHFGVLIRGINLDANVPGDWSGTIDLTIFREK